MAPKLPFFFFKLTAFRAREITSCCNNQEGNIEDRTVELGIKGWLSFIKQRVGGGGSSQRQGRSQGAEAGSTVLFSFGWTDGLRGRTVRDKTRSLFLPCHVVGTFSFELVHWINEKERSVERIPEWKSGDQMSALSPILWASSDKSLWGCIVLICQMQVIWLISTWSKEVQGQMNHDKENSLKRKTGVPFPPNTSCYGLKLS